MDDDIEKKIKEAKEDVMDRFKSEIGPIIRNAKNDSPDSFLQYGLDDEQPCPEVLELWGELNSMFTSHISQLQSIGVKQILLYLFHVQGFIAMMRTILEMGLKFEEFKKEKRNEDEIN